MHRSVISNPPSGNTIEDRFGRIFDYLRISVIENCNLRCVYCMPEHGVKFASRKELMQTAEILRIAGIAAGLGVKKIRFTGGEPLMREDFVALAGKTCAIEGIQSVHITTNGLLLDDKIDVLKQNGIHGINISLDTKDPEKFLKISRRSGVEKVLSSIDNAVKAGFPSVKVNVVLMRGFNDDEIIDFAEMTKEQRLTVRFIELMPFDAHQIWKTGRFFGVELMQKELRQHYGQLAVTEGSSTEHHIYRIHGYQGKIALIPSFTRSLCSGCTRIRLTADGKIRNCLYAADEYELLSEMRKGATDAEIANILKTAMWQKAKDGWESQRASEGGARSSMTQIGG